MTGKCVHRIQITNLSDGETVNHALLLIKGRISREGGGCGGIPAEACSGNSGIGEDNVQDDQQIHLFIWSDQREQFSCKAPVSRSSGEFKLLVDLRGQRDPNADASEEELTLCLRYCNAEERRLRIVCNSSTGGDYRLQPLLILCRDEEAAAADDAIEKIDLNLQLVQAVYAEKLRAAGFGRRTFTLNGSCRIFRTQLTCVEAWQREEDALWSHFAAELLNSPTWGQHYDANKKLKFVAFIACTKYEADQLVASGDYSYANIRRHLKAHAALGGGGLALFGSAYFYAWPRSFETILECFSDSRKVDPAELPDDSNYRRNYGGVYASSLGAICHELGHTFDLGHSRDGVMGADFDYVNRVFMLDTLTENLPARIIHKGVLDTPVLPLLERSRLTRLKRPTSNSFLDKYHEQRLGDSFYFTRNCALILAHHKWLRGGHTSEANATVAALPEVAITFDFGSNSVISPAHALKIIEVRCHANSLVAHFYEFGEDVLRAAPAVFRFQLPAEALNCCLQQSHYLFVMTQDGHTKRLFEEA